MGGVHSKLGASKADRWLHCPGSVALCETVPPAPSSKFADEGSAAHWFAERILSGFGEPVDWLGQRCPEYPEYVFDDEMAAAVEVWVDHCRSLYHDRQGDIPGIEYAIEHRFALSEIDDVLFGTCDFFAYRWFDAHLDVRDYKHGAGVMVAPQENAQVSYYALGAIQEILSWGAEVRSVTIGIVQPRAPGKAVKLWSPTLEWLADYSETLRHGVEATRQPDAPLSAGTWCRFCDAKGVCPAYQPPKDHGDFRGLVDRSAKADFADLPDLDGIL